MKSKNGKLPWAVEGLPRRVSLLLRIPLLLTCSKKKLRQRNVCKFDIQNTSVGRDILQCGCCGRTMCQTFMLSHVFTARPRLDANPHL